MTDASAITLSIAPALARLVATADAIDAAIVDVSALATPEDETRAGELLRAIHTVIAQAEDQRKAAKAPHLAAGRAVDDAFRAPVGRLERVRDLLRNRLAEAARGREAARVAALEAARLAATAGDHEAASAAIETIDIAGLDRAPVAGISERWTWEVESVEIAAVPATFLAVRMDLVRAEISAANREGREPKVPGISFKKTATVVARRGDR